MEMERPRKQKWQIWGIFEVKLIDRQSDIKDCKQLGKTHLWFPKIERDN